MSLNDYLTFAPVLSFSYTFSRADIGNLVTFYNRIVVRVYPPVISLPLPISVPQYLHFSSFVSALTCVGNTAELQSKHWAESYSSTTEPLIRFQSLEVWTYFLP